MVSLFVQVAEADFLFGSAGAERGAVFKSSITKRTTYLLDKLGNNPYYYSDRK